MDWDLVQSTIRTACYLFIFGAGTTTGISLMCLARNPKERRLGLKHQASRWARFMFAIGIWGAASTLVLVLMDGSTMDVRYLLTLPAIILAIGVADVWHFFCLNGGKRFD